VQKKSKEERCRRKMKSFSDFRIRVVRQVNISIERGATQKNAE